MVKQNKTTFKKWLMEEYDSEPEELGLENLKLVTNEFNQLNKTTINDRSLKAIEELDSYWN